MIQDLEALASAGAFVVPGLGRQRHPVASGISRGDLGTMVGEALPCFLVLVIWPAPEPTPPAERSAVVTDFSDAALLAWMTARRDLERGRAMLEATQEVPWEQRVRNTPWMPERPPASDRTWPDPTGEAAIGARRR